MIVGYSTGRSIGNGDGSHKHLKSLEGDVLPTHFFPTEHKGKMSAEEKEKILMMIVKFIINNYQPRTNGTP